MSIVIKELDQDMICSANRNSMSGKRGGPGCRELPMLLRHHVRMAGFGGKETGAS